MKINRTIREYAPDQLLLLPPDMREWLPEDHLVWFVRDVVAQLDLRANATTGFETEPLRGSKHNQLNRGLQRKKT